MDYGFVSEILEKVCQRLEKLYALETPMESLNSDFIEVHAQALAALKAWCHWLSQLHR